MIIPIGFRWRATSESMTRKKPRDGLSKLTQFLSSYVILVFDMCRATVLNCALFQAGLFSGVATAFIVEFYKKLEADPKDQSNHYLSYISTQIPNIPLAVHNTSAAPQLLPQPTAFTFKAQHSDVVINALWFASLVNALIAASMSTLVKQFIQHYADEDYSSSREQVRVRQHRYSGLEVWQLPTMVDVPPLLLRVALTLFLLGMVSFLWNVQSTVLWTVAIPIIIWLVAYGASIVLPSIYPNCPYKSPEAAIFYLFVRLGTEAVRRLSTLFRKSNEAASDIANAMKQYVPIIFAWTEREHRVKTDSSLDVDILVTADRTFADMALAGSIKGCLRDLPGSTVMECVSRILCQRLGVKWEQVGFNFRYDDAWQARFPRVTKRCGEALIEIVSDALYRFLLDYKAGPLEIWVLHAVRSLSGLLNVFDWDDTATAFDTKLRKCLSGLLSCGLQSAFRIQVLAILRARPVLCQPELSPRKLRARLWFEPELIASISCL